MEGDRMFPGQRFCPMEDELIMFYLKPKVNGMQVPGDGDVICEMDLYGDQDPWNIWKDFEARKANDLRRNKDLYFFTQKKKKTARSSRACRTVGSGGTWKGQNGKEVFLLDENQQPTTTVLGFKKTYTYKNKGSVHDGRWIMYEFEIHESQVKKQANKNDYLLRKNDVLPEKKRKRKQEEEILEDFVENDDGDNDTDHESVAEVPQEKRQRLLQSLEPEQEQIFLPAPALEAEQEQNMQPAPSLEAEQEAVTRPIEDQPLFFQEDDMMELQQSDLAILERWREDEFDTSPATLEDEEISVQNDENRGLQHMEADHEQLVDENLEQQLDAVPLFAIEDENLVEKRGVEANLYGGKLGDALVEDWSMAYMEGLMNDDQPHTMEVGDWDSGYVDFGYNLAF